MATMTVINGPLKGQSWAIQKNGTIRIGRREGNDWVLDDGSVSGTHCEIEKSDAGILIRDLGSTNGTKVNGEPAKEKFLFRNDIFYLGEVPLTIAGDDVPLSSERPDAPTSLPRNTIVIEPTRKITPPKEFSQKSNSNKAWIAVIVLLILGIALLMVKLILGNCG